MNDQMQTRFAWALAAIAIVALVGPFAQGANVSLTASDTSNESSWASGLHWAGGLAPSAGNDYFTSNFSLRTVTNGGGSTFAGDSLTVNSGGFLLLRSNSGTTQTVDNLILDGGTVSQAQNTRTNTLAGNITLSANTTSTFNTGSSNRVIIVTAPITGGGSLHVTGGADTSYTALAAANTFTGSTTVSTTDSNSRLRLQHLLALQNSAVNTAGLGQISLNAGSGAYTLGGLSGSKDLASVITTNLSDMTTLVLNPQSGTVSYSGVIANGAMNLTKTGAGTQVLSGNNTYSGITTISAGTLALSGTGSIADSSQIVIGSGATLDITGLSGSFSLGASQTLSGTGTFLATGTTIVANGTLSPGNSPGTAIQDGGVLQLAADANYNWQVYDASGVAGTGYDTTSLINGATLDLSLLSSVNPYNINLWSLSGIGPDVDGNAINFANTQIDEWTLFSQDSSISGFSADKFKINVGAFNGTSGFSNDLGGGSFNFSLNGGGNAIMLNFIPVPEPSTFALLAAVGGLAGVGYSRRRPRRA